MYEGGDRGAAVSNKPKVSVVLTVYKERSPYLELCLKSLLNQTFDDIEIVIVTDPISPNVYDDEVMLVLDRYRDDKRLKIHMNKVREGFVKSLNKAILLSRGDFIARADSDDVYDKRRIEYQVEYSRRLNLDVVGSWAKIIDENNKIIGVWITPINDEEIRKTLPIHTPFIHSSVLIKRSILLRAGLYNVNYFGAEDYFLWYTIASRNGRLGNVPHFLTFYRVKRGSILRNFRNYLIQRTNYFKVKWAILSNPRFVSGMGSPRKILLILHGIGAFFIPPYLDSKAKEFFFNIIYRRDTSKYIFGKSIAVLKSNTAR